MMDKTKDNKYTVNLNLTASRQHACVGITAFNESIAEEFEHHTAINIGTKGNNMVQICSSPIIPI